MICLYPSLKIISLHSTYPNVVDKDTDETSGVIILEMAYKLKKKLLIVIINRSFRECDVPISFLAVPIGSI